MFSSYRVIFQHPGTKAFSGAGFIARMTVSMMGIGIITMIAQLRDSFFMAGVTAAVYTFSAAFCAPLIARLVDRYGQSRILPKTLVISVLSGKTANAARSAIRCVRWLRAEDMRNIAWFMTVSRCRWKT